MATFDFGGGCPCGLYKECVCEPKLSFPKVNSVPDLKSKESDEQKLIKQTMEKTIYRGFPLSVWESFLSKEFDSDVVSLLIEEAKKGNLNAVSKDTYRS